jgi:hypothetical protein
LPTDHADILMDIDLRFPDIDRASEKPEAADQHENNRQQADVFDIPIKHRRPPQKVKKS